MTGDPRRDSATLLEEIVAKDPATALYLPLAERLREEGRVEEALRLCEERRDRPGAGVGDSVVLGRCYLAAGRLIEARGAFEQALALDRENVAALKALAGILAHQGEHPRAADLYRAVCRVDPGDLESQTALHQITSGEYPESRSPEIVIGQGDVTWEPVRLPREEEHLAELSLGLRTIGTFDQADRAAEAAPVEPAAATGAEAAATGPRAEATRTRKAPVEKSVDQNRSAFQDWLLRMGQGGDR
jgi:tetratricopeptide (TPR) repeat protein